MSGLHYFDNDSVADCIYKKINEEVKVVGKKFLPTELNWVIIASKNKIAKFLMLLWKH